MIVGSCAGSLYALDRKSGEPLWLYDTSVDGSPAQFHGEPLLLGNRLIIPTDAEPKGHLYAFDPASGEVLWKVPFDGGVGTSPVLIGERVVVVSVRGEVAAVEVGSGKELWRVSPAGVLKADRSIVSPARFGDRIVVADNTDQLLALDSMRGKTVWRTTLPARANTSLVVIGDHVVVGTADGFLNWIAAKTGAVKKRVRLGGIPYGTPMPVGALLLILAGSGPSRLVALDAATGAVRWERQTPTEWTTFRPLLTGAVVIAGNDGKTLCAFDRASGAQRWCRPVGQTPRGLGMSQDGMLYVGSLSGVVQAFPMIAQDTREDR